MHGGRNRRYLNELESVLRIAIPSAAVYRDVMITESFSLDVLVSLGDKKIGLVGLYLGGDDLVGFSELLPTLQQKLDHVYATPITTLVLFGGSGWQKKAIDYLKRHPICARFDIEKNEYHDLQRLLDLCLF